MWINSITPEMQSLFSSFFVAQRPGGEERVLRTETGTSTGQWVFG